VVLKPAELSLLLEGLEWRHTEPTWKPTAAG
jgi:transposase